MKSHHIFILFFSLLFLSSCEEVIILDLKETSPQPVIEANLNASTGTCQVLILKSNGFYDTNSFEKIENATVELIADSGIEYAFSEINNGEYFTDNITVTSGQEFTIKITDTDNTVYQAIAQVPFPVVLSSLESSKSNGSFGNPDAKYDVFLNWTDLANEVNFYRARVTVNGEYQANDYFLYTDENQDGDDIRTSLTRKTFKEEDIVQIELVSINKAVHKYFSDLSDIQGSGFDATTPFNPKSNFDNDALGYFGIWYADTKEILVE